MCLHSSTIAFMSPTPPIIPLWSGTTHHKAGVGGDAVCDCLYPAVWEEDGVLALHGPPVTRLLLVEVVPDVVLDGIAVSAEIISCFSDKIC